MTWIKMGQPFAVHTFRQGGGGTADKMTDHDDKPVAIVDDDVDVLDSLRFFLEIAGYPVSVYSSGEAYLEDRPRFVACLVLDHHMPRMTGLELAARLRADGIATPMLLITGSPSPAIVSRAKELGVEQVLEKPVTEADLLRFVAAHG
jgi:two-component system response regulator FixJ